MSGIEAVFVRLADDPGFADAIRAHPAEALRGYDLSDDDLRRLDAAIGSARPPGMAATLGVDPGAARPQ
jgi:hypothetical protein